MVKIACITATREEIQVEVGLSKHGTLHRQASFESSRHFKAYEQIDACDLAKVMFKGRSYFIAHCGQNFLDEAQRGTDLVRFCKICFPGSQEQYEEYLEVCDAATE